MHKVCSFDPKLQPALFCCVSAYGEHYSDQFSPLLAERACVRADFEGKAWFYHQTYG